VYARRVGGEALDFSHRGWLYEESFLFYDEKTDSLWVQATGEAVSGPYRGTRLERLPATQTTWGQWRRQHPDTLVLGQKPEARIRYAHDSYARYYERGGGIKHRKAGPLHVALAVLVGSKAKLYPFAELAKSSFAADSLDQVPVLVVFHAASRTALAFDRRHEEVALEFGSADATATDVLLKDRRTGSTWSGLTGKCLSGPARGAKLKQLLTTQFVQENWRLHYPGAPIYKAP
jgi:hypothetical protein